MQPRNSPGRSAVKQGGKASTRPDAFEMSLAPMLQYKETARLAMDSKPRRPQHPSYRLHRKQAAWQIILPIVLAGLILIGATSLILVGTFRDNGDVGRWAAISTIWLTIPVMIGGLVVLALFVGLADIDPDNPGMEFYIGEKQLPDRWMYSARTGKLLSTEDLGTLAPTPVYWLDGNTKLYLSRERLKRYKGPDVGRVEGRVLASGDLLGDWREELVTTLPGELRIYSTTVPAASRRVCLLEERAYRTAVAMQSSGYFYPPQVRNP